MRTLDDNINVEKGTKDARFGEIEKAILGINMVGKMGGRKEIREQIVGIGLDNMEDVWTCQV